MRWLSKETRKEDTEVQDNIELGREFQRATVDGRKDCNLRCVLQRGIASVSLRKDCLARTETHVGSCARRAGGPWPCISFHSRTNFKRRLLQASVGHPIISRTTEFDATRRPFFTGNHGVRIMAHFLLCANQNIDNGVQVFSVCNIFSRRDVDLSSSASGRYHGCSIIL